MSFHKKIEKEYDEYYDEYDDDDEVTQKNWEFAPVIGGEFFFNEHFSFGGECSFNYTSYGIPKYKGVDDDVYDDIDYSNTRMTLKPLVFVRWYF